MKRMMVLSGALFLLGACTASKRNKKAGQAFDTQGHRGCRGLMPENTIPAMIKAIDLGVRTLEMDAVITQDKLVTVSHEPFFNHEITTKPDGTYVEESEERSLNIYHMTYEEVKRFDVGLKPHPRFPQQQKIRAVKPLLGELIDSVENYCSLHQLPLPYYNIETKTQPLTDGIYHPGPKEFVDLLIHLIQSKGVEKRVIIQSFDFRTLQYLHQQYPFFPTAMLVEADDKRSFKEQFRDLGFTPTIYSPEFSLVNEAMVSQCHRQKMKLIPWTVDDLEKMKELKQMGVDGIISDYPNLFRELR